MKPLTILSFILCTVLLSVYVDRPEYWRIMGYSIYVAAVLVAWECIAIQRERRK